ncbi:MAG TPA: protein kinase, partial [Methylomirabilota bacterium]|nr:protein kinase [Methylomirabilota bacterium]
MELVRGIKITDYCDQEKVSTRERLDLFIKVCQAIQHAHQKGIIHRDIKPSNILVTLHDGVPVPKVIDFGIAKATEGRLTDQTVYTQLHQFIGTPAYMSPEQAEMSGLDIDTRSDIYSLGVLLYELLAGSTPFDAKELMAQGIDAMRKTIREQEPQRPSTRVATLGADQLTTTAKRRSADSSKLLHQLKGDLDWIVMKCLEKDRSRRYETANGLAADLKRHLNNEPVTARPPSAAYRFQKAWRRNKLAYTAAATVTATLVLGIAFSAWQAIEATRAEAARAEEARRAQAAQAQAEADRARAVFAEREERRRLYAANMNLAFEALKANRLGRTSDLLNSSRPSNGGPDYRGWEWRYLWSASRSDEILTLPPHEDIVSAIAWSPNQPVLASGSWDGSVRLWNTRDYRSISRLQNPGKISSLAFNSTGDLLAVISGTEWGVPADGKVSLWRTDSHELFDRFHVDQADVWFLERGSVRFSPDDSFLAVGQGNGEILFRDHRQRRNLVAFPAHPPGKGVLALAFSTDGRLLASGGRDESVKIWKARGLAEAPLLQHQLPLGAGRSDFGVFDLEFSPSGDWLAGCGMFGATDAGLRIWRVRDGRPVLNLTNHTAWVAGLAFSRDGHHLFSVSSDQSVRIWETGAWEEVAFLKGHTNEIWSVGLSPDGRRLATGGKDNLIKLWDTQFRGRATDSKVFPDYRKVVFSRDSSTLLSIDPDGRWTIRDSEIVGEVSEFPVPTSVPIRDFIDLAAGVLAITHTNGTVQVWNVPAGRLMKIVPEADPAWAPVLSPDGERLAFTSSMEPQVIRVVALSSSEEIASLRSGRAQLPRAFSADGTLLIATPSNSDDLILWNVRTSRSSQHEAALREQTQTICFSPDGSMLAAVGGLGLVNLFDVTNSDLQLRWRVNPDLLGLFGACFSPDGRRLAVVSSTGVIWLCDTSTGQEVGTLKTAKGMWSNATFSPSGNNLLVHVAEKLHLYQA